MADKSEPSISKGNVVISDSTTDAHNLTINSDGSAAIKSKGTISTSNSSSSTLGISGVFTGTLEEITDLSTIMVSVFTDEDSATDGLSIQQSVDGTNWDFTDVFTISADTGKNFSIPTFAKFFRIVYTNGTTAQTIFRLQSILKAVSPKPSTHRIQDDISTDDDAELVKAVLTGKTNGTFINAAVTSSGALKVESTVTAPAAATIVIQENFEDIATTSGSDTLYTITNSTTLTIQLFSAGSEENVGGSVTELFEDPNGDLSVLNRINTIFTNGANSSELIRQDFTGDGTRRIVMRQRGYTASAREMFGRWQGFEE